MIRKTYKGTLYEKGSRKDYCKCGKIKCARSKSCKVCGYKKISKFMKGRTPKNLSLINKNKKGSGNPAWKGGITLSNGYMKVHAKKHPYRDRDGYVFVHRLIMEQRIGRLLKKEEVVHHKDSNTLNNNPDNLVLFKSIREHLNFHRKNDRRTTS